MTLTFQSNVQPTFSLIIMLMTFLMVFTIYTVYVEPKAQKEYGKFNLAITDFDVCKGPKQKDCANSSAVISNSSTINYDMTVFENVSPTKGKIVATTNGKDMLRLQMKKPCEHVFFRPLFTALMNVTKDCFVIKGHYRFNVDIVGIAESYFGGTFVFGNWTFKSVFYNEACNFSCATIHVAISPKKNN